MQTAVEWLDRWFRDNPEATHEEGNKALQQAKEMERKQHSKTWDKALDAFESRGHNYVRAWEDFDEHFKQFSLYEHKETIATADTITSSQTEISDEEIEMAALHNEPRVTRRAFKSGAKWAINKLKNTK